MDACQDGDERRHDICATRSVNKLCEVRGEGMSVKRGWRGVGVGESEEEVKVRKGVGVGVLVY